MSQNKPERGSGVRFSEFAIGGEDREEYKAAMLKASAQAVADLPSLLKKLRDMLHDRDPFDILSIFTGYGLLTTVDDKGVTNKKALANILPHHGELLQAIMLTIPVDKLGRKPVGPDIMETVFETVPLIAKAFIHQRVLEGAKINDEQQMVVLSLQERIRMHTHAVRNWGYYGDVKQISLDLYQSIDQDVAKHHGFSCTDLIELMAALVAEFERRQSERWDTLSKILQGRKPSKVFELYFQLVPGLVGTADEIIAGWPGVNLEAARAMVMSHFDLRMKETATFEIEDVATITSRPADQIEKMLRSIAREPGSLVGTKDEFLFLGNPIWDAPVVDMGESFFIPMPQAFFSHIHRIMERLATEAGAKEKLERARNAYLEGRLEHALRSAFPHATVTSGSKWKIGVEQYETDALVVIDRTVLIAEAKANRVTPEGLRGAPDRVKRHVRDMVLDPSVQSERLAKLINDAKAGDATATSTVKELGIDPSIVDQIVRISVTLDDMSVLSSAVDDFKKVGWVPQDHELAPTILIADLLCVIDILDNPLLLLHYLSERVHFQSSFELMGDELDFLGLYLATGFNLGKGDKTRVFAPSGMSEPIDRYFNSRDAGISISKPTARLSQHFRKIVDRLTDRRPHGWTTVGLHLLSAASPSEQRALESNLERLRKNVRKTYQNPKHINTIHIRPPLARKAQVGFYLFPEELRPQHRHIMEGLAAEALSRDGVETVVIFGRSTENWCVPYETVMLTKECPPLTS
ncbi:hypothetical protein [Ensifer sp. ENS11]|uniref:hypothetical protein n=1 Tax=Ensifer sp. ENS11 TaxID=2769291 RepID=UPI00177AB28D|nr:hypothetical protein [Ensifer sp. ENS11]MBD9488737.1 hypothetical protein [Ensifer sp. ENS11]